MVRRLVFQEGGSDKFWEVAVEGAEMVIRFGRVGTAGQTQRKSFADANAAEAEAEKQAQGKIKKGYRPAETADIPPSVQTRSAGVDGSPADPLPTKPEAPTQSTPATRKAKGVGATDRKGPEVGATGLAARSAPEPGVPLRQGSQWDGPRWDGSINRYVAASGASFQITLSQGDLPDAVPLGEWTYKTPHAEFTNKVQLGNFSGLRWDPIGHRFLVLDSRIFAYGAGAEGFVGIWNTSPFEDTERLVNQPTDAVFSADGRRVWVTFAPVNDQHNAALVRELDAATGEAVATFSLPGHDLRAIAVHPGGDLIALVAGNWSTAPSAAFLFHRDGTRIPLGAKAEGNICFSPDGSLVAANTEGQVHLFDLQGKVVWRGQQGPGELAFFADGRLVISARQILDPHTLQTTPIPVPETDGRWKNMLVDPAGTWVGACFAYPGRIRLWGLDGRVVRELPIPPGNSETHAAVNTNGWILCGVNWQKKLHLYPAGPRTTLLTVEASGPADKPKSKTRVYADPAEGLAEGRKLVAAREKKGFTLVDVRPPQTPEQAADERRWETVVHHKLLAPFVRTAWKPRIEPMGMSNSASPQLSTSPLGSARGPARLRPGESWPRCPNCSRPMDLFLELDLSALPPAAPARGLGLLQVFYCTSTAPNCEVETEAYFPGPGKSKLVRVVSDAAPEPVPAPPIAAVSGLEDEEGGGERPIATPVQIVAWEAQPDLPNAEELETLVRRLPDDDARDALLEGLPVAGDKLAGWCAWVQGVEYPTCPHCGKPQSRPIFQLASDGMCGFQWGDLGTAFITACPDHREAVDLVWQCG